MFEAGKAYKIQVELASGKGGFGRATVLNKDASRILITVKTSREANEIFPKGTKLWLVGDAPDNPFNGLWSTMVVGARIVGGRTVMECPLPKFEKIAQRRSARRLPIECPVKVLGNPGTKINYEVWAKNISSSGVGLETTEQHTPEFEKEETVGLIIQSSEGDIPVDCIVKHKQYNWLANRNTIGLEFSQLSPEAAKVLNQLLESLGQKESSTEPENQQAGSLSNWMKSTSENTKFIKLKPDNQSSPDHPDIPNVTKDGANQD